MVVSPDFQRMLSTGSKQEVIDILSRASVKYDETKGKYGHAKSTKVEQAAVKSLLNSQAEEQHFKVGFEAVRNENRIDVPRIFRISSNAEKESVYRVRDRLRQNRYAHMQFDEQLQSPSGAKLLKGMYEPNQQFPRSELIKSYAQYAHDTGNVEGMRIKLLELFNSENNRINFQLGKAVTEDHVRRERINKEFPKVGASKFLRDLSALTGDNAGRDLSAEKWRDLNRIIDKVKGRIAGQAGSSRATIQFVEQLVDDGYQINEIPLKKTRPPAFPSRRSKTQMDDYSTSAKSPKVVMKSGITATQSEQQNEEVVLRDILEQNAIKTLNDESVGLSSKMIGSTEYGTNNGHGQQLHAQVDFDTFNADQELNDQSNLHVSKSGAEFYVNDTTELGGNFSGIKGFASNENFDGLTTPKQMQSQLQLSSGRVSELGIKKDISTQNFLIGRQKDPLGTALGNQEAKFDQTEFQGRSTINILDSNRSENEQIMQKTPRSPQGHFASQILKIPACKEDLKSFSKKEKEKLLDHQAVQSVKKQKKQKPTDLNWSEKMKIITDKKKQNFSHQEKQAKIIANLWQRGGESEFFPPIHNQSKRYNSQISQSTPYSPRNDQYYINNKKALGSNTTTYESTEMQSRNRYEELSRTIDNSHSRHYNKYQRLRLDDININDSNANLQQHINTVKNTRNVNQFSTVEDRRHGYNYRYQEARHRTDSMLGHNHEVDVNKKLKANIARYKASSTLDIRRGAQSNSPHGLSQKSLESQEHGVSPAKRKVLDVLDQCGERRSEQKNSARIHTEIQQAMNSLDVDMKGQREIFANYVSQLELEGHKSQTPESEESQPKLRRAHKELKSLNEVRQLYEHNHETDFRNFLSKDAITNAKRAGHKATAMMVKYQKRPRIWKPAKMKLCTPVIIELEKGGFNQ